MRVAVFLISWLLFMTIVVSANDFDCKGHLCVANQPIKGDQNNIIKLELINPSEIKNGQSIGEYVILTQEDIQNIAISLSNGATINGPILTHSDEITVSEGGKFYQKWKELQGQLEDTQFTADIVALLIVGGSPSELGIKVLQYIFNKNSPVTIKEPPELAAQVGDVILNVAQEKNDQLFSEILKTYGVNGVIIISPGTSLILEIPVKASTSSEKCSLDLSIPYRYYKMNQPMTGKPLNDQLKLIQADQRKYWGQYFGIKDMQEIKDTFKASVECEFAGSSAINTASGASALEGNWEGTYFYSDGRAPVKFSAVLTQNGNIFSGRTQEANTFGDASAPLLFANIYGSIADDVITFVKTYDGTGNVNHSVNYNGKLDLKTGKISGTWTIGSTTGSFEMSLT